MNFPVYISIGNWHLHPHILFEALGYAIAFRLLLLNCRQDNIPFNQRSSVMVGGILGAIVGAKILVLLQHINLFWENWQYFLLLLLQGKTVVGGLIGGLIGVEITKKIIGVKRSTGDAFVYPLLIGTAIGRIGCFLTGLNDKTYGIPTSLPWGINFGDGITRHPTQIYEIIFIIMLIFYLNFRNQYYIRAGELFRFYMISYLGFRLIIDFIKPEYHLLLGLSAVQLACLICLIYYLPHIPNLFKFQDKNTQIYLDNQKEYHSWVEEQNPNNPKLKI